MSGKLILSVGLPGSGKSTEAMKQVKDDPKNVIRANRDDIRTALFGESYHKKNPNHKAEANVTHVQRELIQNGLREGKTVIVDDTNLNRKSLRSLVQFGKRYTNNIEFVHCDVPLEECIRRNKERGRQGGREVPEEIIRSMAARAYGTDGHLKEWKLAKNGELFFVQKNTEGSKKVDDFNKELERRNPAKGKAVVFVDMDGTLFNNDLDSVRYLEMSKEKDFEKFYTSIEQAPVNQKVLSLVENMYDNDDLTAIAVTGRSDDYAENLINALKNSHVKISKLIMKKEGDDRPSSEQKEDVVKDLQKQGYRVVHAIEDRKKDLEMFRQNGIMTTIVEKPVFDRQNLPEELPEPQLNTIYGGGYCIRCGSKLKDPNKNIGDACRKKSNI